LGHIINLVVQAFLFHNAIEMEELALYDKLEAVGQLNLEETKRRFCLLGPLGQLYNILVHSRGSAGRTEEFLALTTRMCLLNNCTRWNSWHKCCVVADTLAQPIDTYTKSHWEDLEKDYLSPSD
jgi:hypothetical protein